MPNWTEINKQHRRNADLCREQTKSGDGLLALLLFGLGASVIGWWGATSYFNVDVAESISFRGNDGWCEPTDEGLGVHCWGDYYFPVLLSEEPNPWTSPLGSTPYPALGLLPFRLLGNLTTFVGVERLGLIVFLVALCISLSAVALWASSHFTLDRTAAVLLVIGPASVPALIAIDRANPIGLAAPALLWFAVATLRENYRGAAVAVVAAAAIKPQYVILVVILLSVRRWREALVAVSAALGVHLIAFLFWPRPLQTIRDALASMSAYQDYQSIGADYPPNISLARGLFVVERALRQMFGITTETWHSVDYGHLTGVAVLGLFAVASIFLGSRVPIDFTIIVVIALASIATGTSYGYYTVFGAVIAALILRPVTSGTPNEPSAQTWSHRLVRYLVIGATVLTIIRVPLPGIINAATDGIVTNTNAQFIPLAWTIVAVTGLAMVLFDRLPGNRIFNEGPRSASPAISSQTEQ